MTSRRLLMTTDAVGGVWTYALELATGLRPFGWDTVLAVLGPAPSPDQRRAARDLSTALVETGLPLDWLCDAAGPVLAAGDHIAALAREVCADLVQLNTPALAARAQFDVPVVVVEHGGIAPWWEAAHATPLPPAFAWQRDLAQAGMTRADTVVAPSNAHAATVARLHALSTPPIAVYNGRRMLATATDLPAAGHVFTAGRLWDQIKNTALLDRIAARLGVPFRAAGPLSGPHGHAVSPAHLDWLGVLPEAGLAAELAARPVFVSATRFEPFGLAVLEAAAAGCALVLSDIATFRELWSDAAVFVAGDDEQAWAEAIGGVVNDPAGRNRLGEAAQVRAARYTPDATAAAMASVFARLAHRPRQVAA